MASKKGFKWKGILLATVCLLVGVGGTIGTIKLIEHFKKPAEDKEQVEQTPEDETTTTSSIEEQIAIESINQYI